MCTAITICSCHSRFMDFYGFLIAFAGDYWDHQDWWVPGPLDWHPHLALRASHPCAPLRPRPLVRVSRVNGCVKRGQPWIGLNPSPISARKSGVGGWFSPNFWGDSPMPFPQSDFRSALRSALRSLASRATRSSDISWQATLPWAKATEENEERAKLHGYRLI